MKLLFVCNSNEVGKKRKKIYIVGFCHEANAEKKFDTRNAQLCDKEQGVSKRKSAKVEWKQSNKLNTFGIIHPSECAADVEPTEIENRIKKRKKSLKCFELFTTKQIK